MLMLGELIGLVSDAAWGRGAAELVLCRGGLFSICSLLTTILWTEIGGYWHAFCTAFRGPCYWGIGNEALSDFLAGRY